MKRILKIVKGTVFLLLFLLGLKIANGLLYPTNDIIKNWQSFYEQKKETVDVLVIGSSHAYSSFDTDLMGEILGERAYLLASNSQTMDISYYYLKEALRYQSPKTVVLEAFGTCGGTCEASVGDNDWKKLSSTDGMRWGPGKVETILNRYAPQNWASAFFPIIRSHTNWKDTQQIQENWAQWKGHTQDFSPFRCSKTRMSDETAALYEQMRPDGEPIIIYEKTKEYFLKIADLCRNNGIELVVVMAPMYKGYIEKINYQSWHDALAELCTEAHAEFIDCNEAYETLGMEQTDFENAFNDYHHLNGQGAEKVTRYVAEKIAK